jgi:predicted anti-sigma-YlaC factor YlaD
VNMATSDEMACKALVELVTEYFEDKLSPVEKARFELHLRGCSGCRNYLEQMRETIRMVGRLTEESLSPAAQQEHLAIFRDWRKR